jgi:SAM-dependent methyltransferase
MTFAVSADAYDRFMGRYSAELAAPFADFAGVAAGLRALDVGCGPGALTGELVDRLGADAVSAVDPSESFVSAARERYPGADVRQASAERLPFGDGEFDVALAQLVVHFMSDPDAGVRELARVTRRDGVVAACVWDYAGERSPLTVFWQSARELDPEAEDESQLAGAGEGRLAALFGKAGLRDVVEAPLSIGVDHAGFEAWWEPFTLGVGPAGAYAAGLDDERRSELRERCRGRLPAGPFRLAARAWAARGLA